ncbi:hypothetical protein [Phage f2b1]|nr:hypothetical protein [Phage f2b1]
MAKAFAWDSEKLIDTIEETEKKHHDVSICELRGKQYVSIAEKQLTNEGWKFKKNRTMPLDVFKAAQSILEGLGE